MPRFSANIAVITGGPGSGKTTLCDKLSREGLAIGSESGRAVLARKNGHALRSQNPLSYALEILNLDIAKFQNAATSDDSWLFDRGFPDNAGFLKLMGLPRPKKLADACRNYRYAGPVFVAPPWQEIYHSDPDRIQDWQEAKATYFAVTEAWNSYGYSLIELPKVSVEQRAIFVKECLA
ncbi:AAA family ATPase [Parasphingorhabdus sp.]|uniref:AAA family ATPase n=1 Tax=Parasphingorhabdus sp. TaxID=2709688 RepID=UPI003A930667